MTPDKNATERLAALIVAAGVLSALPAMAADGSGKSDATKLIDKTPIRIAISGKDSGCGKCGANACGMSYRDRMHERQHTAQQKRMRKKSQRKQSQGNKQAKSR